MKPIQALFQSRKFILALVVTIIGTVFVLKGQLQLADLGKWVAGVTLVLIAAISHEDAAEKAAGGSDTAVVVPPSLPPALPATPASPESNPTAAGAP